MSLLDSFKSQFTKDETSIGMTNLAKMQIDTGNFEPVSQNPYPIAMKPYNWVKDEINKLLDVNLYAVVIPAGQLLSWQSLRVMVENALSLIIEP